MTAEDVLEQISEILDDDTTASDKVYMIKDIICSEVRDVPFTTPRERLCRGVGQEAGA